MGSFGDHLAVAYRAAALRRRLYHAPYPSSSGLQSGGEPLRFTPLESTQFPFSTAGATGVAPISQPRMGQQYQQQQLQHQQLHHQQRETRVLAGSGAQQHQPQQPQQRSTAPAVHDTGAVTGSAPPTESSGERKRGGTSKRSVKRATPKFQTYQDDDDIAAADESALLFQAM
ncbi:ORF98 [black bullhead herpesvirus]|uniref:ORF98 n=1 Tax=black bullhead herpesvirus TaxID=508441 RepID=A0A2H5AJG1_9VIRU|nr:ORF98 [black bullhead herpesvirus]AUG72295.1 ORF98 [black bullhead herpesvirus]